MSALLKNALARVMTLWTSVTNWVAEYLGFSNKYYPLTFEQMIINLSTQGLLTQNEARRELGFEKWSTYPIMKHKCKLKFVQRSKVQPELLGFVCTDCWHFYQCIMWGK